MKLTEWIKLPQDVRMSGIDLTSPCIIISQRMWRHRLPRMLEWLGLEKDVPNLCTAKIHRVHMCDSNSCAKDGVCCNPLHWFIGTAYENAHSKPPEKRGNGSWWTGKTHTKEARKKMVKANRGRITSEETKRKMSATHAGVPKSEEHRRKMVEAWKLRKARIRCRHMSLSDPQMPDFED
jgi:hypothetical protein